MGTDVRIDLTSVSLPTFTRSLLFQARNLAAILSISGCTSILVHRLVLSRSSKYLHGKLFN